MRRALLSCLAVVNVVAVPLCLAPAPARADEARPEVDGPRRGPVIQVALLLDTSNSMDGLINQARTQLWKVVNEFSASRKGGRAPRLQVAVYEYGNNGLSAGEGYVRMVLPLTGDLDRVSEKLFALTTNGGEEYCGRVIREAAQSLAWSDDPDAYRAIFVAGNEPFTQGNVDYRDACADARRRHVVVNTIHCGPSREGVEGKWEEGALLGKGKFMVIDQDSRPVAAATPQDGELTRLAGELNRTYLPYGGAGAGGAARQRDQDDVAAANAPAGTATERAVAKAQSTYHNADWDLVDAAKDKRVDVAGAKAEDLPAEMRKMAPADRAAYVQKQAAARAALQDQINALNAERQKFLKAQPPATQPAGTLDAAMILAVREQLKAQQFERPAP